MHSVAASSCLGRGAADSKLSPIRQLLSKAVPQLPCFAVGHLPGFSSAKESVSLTSHPRAFDIGVHWKEEGIVNKLINCPLFPLQTNKVIFNESDGA